MGGQKHYAGGGQFSVRTYDTVAGTEQTIAGLKCKVVKRKDDVTGDKSALPQFAGSSDVYMVYGTDGKPKQLRRYVNHQMYVDYDWAHTHSNKDGRMFQKGTVHVQAFLLDANGNRVRNSKNARKMNNEEMKTIGKIIKFYNSDVKLK